MLRVPGITDGGGVRHGFTELVDVMPKDTEYGPLYGGPVNQIHGSSNKIHVLRTY